MQRGKKMKKKREQVHASTYAGIGFIVFDAPPANIVTRATFERISSILDDFGHDYSIKAIVFLGMNKNFCGGVSLKWMQSLQQMPEAGNETIEYFYEVARKIHEFPKPIIAAIENGACCGVGFELAMLCDYIVASEKNSSTIEFGALAVRYGFMLGLGVSWRLAHKIGVPNAARFLVKRETTDLFMAGKLGIVDALLPGENFRTEVYRFVHGLLEGNSPKTFTPPFAPKAVLMEHKERLALAPGCSMHAVARTLEALEVCVPIESFSEVLIVDKSFFKTLFFSDNSVEGISAFLERREPKFSE